MKNKKAISILLLFFYTPLIGIEVPMTIVNRIIANASLSKEDRSELQKLAIAERDGNNSGFKPKAKKVADDLQARTNSNKAKIAELREWIKRNELAPKALDRESEAEARESLRRSKLSAGELIAELDARVKTLMVPDTKSKNKYASNQAIETAMELLHDPKYQGDMGKLFGDIEALLDAVDHSQQCGRSDSGAHARRP